MDPLNVEIRKLSPQAIFDLSQILEIGKGWKQLMAIIPSSDDSEKLKYTVQHMNLIENAGERQQRPSTEILFEEWGTSGCRRPHVSDLQKLLLTANLFRAAEYVTVELLKQEAPKRPNTGLAAPVEIPDFLTYSDSDWGSTCHKETTPLSQMNDRLNSGNTVPHLSYKVLDEGTCGFSDERKIGSGGFGTVYLCLYNGEKSAVKKLLDTGAVVQGLTEQQFQTELQVLGGISHVNLLSLIAYSSNGPHLCLVYSYMKNGSLQGALECKNGHKVLDWKERLNIAKGTAKGLEYLHTMKNKPLIHRDIKSANVLLDENLNAKVGDFGLAKYGSSGRTATVHTSTVVGTSAYMAPEVFRGDVSPKGDVFSYGVVVLEIITGLPPFDENRNGCDLASYVDEIDNITELVDKRLEWVIQDIPLNLYAIAQKCLLDKKARPTISSVLLLLEKIYI